MNIIAGEPVPPGFEDEINREAEIQKAIELYKGNALVGLEYTLELHEDDRREPGYFCVLCDKRGDPRTIMQHWTSYNHRLKYLEKHFPTAVREFNPVRYKPNSHQILLSIVQSISKAIEDHHGRLHLTVANGDDFRRMKAKFVGEINSKFHFDERNGPNFLDMIDRSLWEPTPAAGAKNMEQTLQITIKAPKRLMNEDSPSKSNRDDLDEISSESDGQSPGVKKSKKREQSPAYRVLPRVRRSPPFEEERSDERKEAEKKLPTPKELSLQASHIAQEKYKWEKYRCMLEIQLKQMEKIQQDYDKNPEKHPLYPEEWKKFWNRRYKELQSEKKTDPNKYDYKPEWIAFWTERMKDLYKAEVEKKKKEIKVKLGLPEDAEEKVDQLKEKYKVQIGRNAVGITAGGHVLGPKISARNIEKRAKNVGDVINISDDESPIRRRNHHTRSRSRSPHSRSRSRRSRSKSPRNSRGRDYKRSRDRSTSLSKSPVSDEYEPFPAQTHVLRHRHHGHSYVPSTESDYFISSYPSRGRFTSSAHYSGTKHYRVLESHQYPKYERSLSPTSKPGGAAKGEPEPEDDGPLTVVAVLRLLTALEDHLGSLGPKVVDLLGKALALEKIKANSADDLLLNEDHVVFFETIKEKLKGILIADVLDEQQKIRAVKKAIKNIAAVIHQVSSKGNSSNNTNKEPTKGNDNGESGLKVRKNESVSVKDLPFDRQIIATKLAAALVFQGREDVSTEDMDKLIFFFILLVKLSKEKQQFDGKALQLGFILSQLGIYVPNTSHATVLAALPALVEELLENENNTAKSYSQINEDDASNETVDKDSKNDSGGNMLESLTDSDLQTLLQNFKHLSSEEQHHLIAHLKKLESADPLRVEKLRKFVNLTDLSGAAASSPAAGTSKSNTRERSRDSRFDDSPIASNSKSRGHISDDDNDQDDRYRNISVANPNKFSLDDEDEDDDYNVDDVFKAAFRKVSDNSRQSKTETRMTHETASSSRSQMKTAPAPVPAPILPVSSSPNALTFNRAGLNISLSDTQNLIANLMGSLQQSNSNQKSNSNSTQSKEGQQIPTRANIPIQAKNPKNQQVQLQQQQQAQPPSMPYYQQQGQQQQQAQAYPAAGGGYNQMGGMNNQTYYNAMGYNNNSGVGYTGYQPWGMGDGQQFGMQNYMGQPQQGPPQHMGYNNMYGQGPQ